ncbi:MAG TPA: prolyl oligopeptidase family serine peptidase [Vicinamibacterales bacterium]|nr:prolyl oligopeptidase family serine peptidase [Vicinamibacterales bacterium]
MRRVILAFVCAITAPVILSSQTKHPPARSEWGQFEQLALQPRGGLSPDGKWLVYGINRSNRENELRIRQIATGAEKTIAFASQPSFSADSKWIAWAIGYSETQEERLRAQRRPIHRKLGMLRLDGKSEPSVIDGIESFSIDPSGSFIVMRRYAPERAPGGGATPPAPAGPPAPQPPADEPAPAGVTIIVRELDSGRDTSFGNVAEFAWPSVTEPAKLAGRLLAFTISTDDKTGNGIHLYDAASGAHRVLDSSSSVYSGLGWRRDADDLVVLRSQGDDTRDGSTQVALAWTGVAGRSPKSHTLDPVKAVPAGMRTVSFRRPSWSDDGRSVFLGVAEWAAKPPAEKKPDPSGEAPAPAPAPADETPTVDIWHAKDVDVMPRQKISARADRQRNLLAAWDLGSGGLVQLAKTSAELVAPIRRQRLAYAATWDGYAMERSIGRTAADLSLVELETGTRTKVADRIDDGYLRVSPKGRYLLYFRDDHYWTVNTATRVVTNITKSVATAFVDRESDVTTKQKPPYGVAGWTSDDADVLLYDKFDIWQVASDGSRTARLTDGAAEQVRHRAVRLDPDEEWIDLSKPVAIALFGTWSKKSGYGRWMPATRQVERLIFDDRSISGLAKAADADVYVYVTQKFDDSPDAYIAGADLKSARQVTHTNPSLSKYAWGRSEIVEFKSDRGLRLQGSLYYPAGYEPGKKYPMVVYLYEKLSDNVHRFVPPSERDYYNASAFTSQGYLFFQPDIVFRPREPGLSVIECVEPAVRRVVAMGVADPARVGVVGHSWGGFDASYLATHSSVFAAAVAGAAITNLVSNYGNHHWTSGIAETDHIETGQQRMEVPLYEDLQAYIRNSAVFNVHNMKTPLLLEVGDNDGTVHWHQGVELYNIARRARKDVVMLAYGGEDHGLRRKANQIDYQKRIHQWFGHYLKNEPAAPWITSGLRYIDRDKELKGAAAKKGSS